MQPPNLSVGNEFGFEAASGRGGSGRQELAGVLGNAHRAPHMADTYSELDDGALGNPRGCIGNVSNWRVTFGELALIAPTPERCLEAYHLHRTRLELIAERKVRRRQLTDDGNVEITGRDLREREARRHHAGSTIAGLLDEGGATSTSRCRASVSRSDQDRGSAEGLGSRLDQIITWLDANCGADGWI